MEFYQANAVALVALNLCLAYRQYRQDRQTKQSRKTAGGTDAAAVAAEALNNKFKRKFLPVYLLVFGADWLQGPYIYTMYKDEKGLAEETVAYLFTTGFFAAALSATFIGSLADRYGRRTACLFFCITYSLSCFTILSSDIFIIFLGRILGGVSTTLMYSVFESWMVTEYHRQHLAEAGGSLSDIFGTMTTLNGIVAILAGVFAQGVVDVTKTQTAPFLTAVVFLVVAFVLISKGWNENYGDSANIETLDPSLPEKQSKSAFRLVLADKRLWVLCMTSCVFEGTMYLWIFFKFPALKLAHQLAGKTTVLPFGIIFAGLMCAMMVGSLLFTYNSSRPASGQGVASSRLLMVTLGVASACFLVPVFVRNEAVTFWCFCIFEVCCGVYYPSIAQQKERVVEDGVRAKIYAIFRVPLNIFVVVGLSLTKDGENYRDTVFLVCSGALFCSAAAVGRLLAE